jgi:hypothetical protein
MENTLIYKKLSLPWFFDQKKSDPKSPSYRKRDAKGQKTISRYYPFKEIVKRTKHLGKHRDNKLAAFLPGF